jgi:hypothetical protein
MKASLDIPKRKSYEEYLKSKKKSLGDKLAKNGNRVLKSMQKVARSIDLPKVSISDNAKELVNKASIAKDAIKALPLPDISEKKEAPKENGVQKAQKVSPLKKGNIARPAIFFIKGFESVSLSTEYDGLTEIAESIKGSRVYSWDQKEEILEQVKKRRLDQPIILVGHSLGGDAAVEIANELDTLENGFRKIDLIATIDSVGRHNDVIPQNVKTNLNFFGDNTSFLNDGPNVARNNKLTEVVNDLRLESHTELDNSKEVQFKIVNKISEILSMV